MATSAFPTPGLATRRDSMATAALVFLDALDQAARQTAAHAYDAPRRRDWHFVPRERAGLPLKHMTPEQRELVFGLLQAALSDQGLRKVDGVLQLEGILGELTNNPSFRDPENYALVIFGDPAGAAPWSWRFEGHHLSLNFTIVPDVGIAVTPAFFGANPAEVPQHHAHAGLRVLSTEHEIAFELLGSLDATQRQVALLPVQSFGDILTGPGREQSLKDAQGLPLAEMDEAQKALVLRLVDSFLGNMRADLAAAETNKLIEAGADALRFAWAGGLQPDQQHYYRLHGPTAVIEYDDTRGGNHVHSVWHNPADSFGEDLLRRHLEGDH